MQVLKSARDVLDEVARELPEHANQYTQRNMECLQMIGDAVAHVMLNPAEERLVKNCAARIPTGSCPAGYTEFVMGLTTCIRSFGTSAFENRLTATERFVLELGNRTAGLMKIGG